MIMKLKYSLILVTGLFLAACNSEEGVPLSSTNSYMKIIDGLGNDQPVAIKQLSDGSLMVVSNTTLFESGSPTSRIRVLKFNLNGDLLPAGEKYFPNEEDFPENLNQSWTATDFLLLPNDRVILGGNSSGNSMLFLDLNASLDTNGMIIYKDEEDSNELNGLFFDQQLEELLFIGSQLPDNNSTVLGTINSTNFTLDLESILTVEKTQARPATNVIRNNAQQYIWGYNSGGSANILISSGEILTAQVEPLNLPNVDSVKVERIFSNTEELGVESFGVAKRNNEVKIFYKNNQQALFFGASGNNQLNGVHQTTTGYLMTGTNFIPILGSNQELEDFLLIRYDADETKNFTRTFGTSVNEQLHDAILVGNSIYCIGTTVFSGQNTLLLMKTNELGELRY